MRSHTSTVIDVSRVGKSPIFDAEFRTLIQIASLTAAAEVIEDSTFEDPECRQTIDLLYSIDSVG